MLPPVVLVIWVMPEPEVQRKISRLPSALPPVRSLSESKAILVPSALMEGLKLSPPVELVIWVKPEPEVQRKISWLPSALPGLPGVRSLLESKAILVPSALMEGSWLPKTPVVIWAMPKPWVQRKMSGPPSGLPPVRSLSDSKAILVPSALMEGLQLWRSPGELVIWVKPKPWVQRKISELRSGLPPVRSLLETKAILVPFELMEGKKLPPPTEMVIWVKPKPWVQRKISELRSALLPVRLLSDSKAILVPFELMEG